MKKTEIENMVNVLNSYENSIHISYEMSDYFYSKGKERQADSAWKRAEVFEKKISAITEFLNAIGYLVYRNSDGYYLEKM